MDIPHWFIQSSVDGHLGCFHWVTVTNNAFKNICIVVFTQMCMCAKSQALCPWYLQARILEWVAMPSASFIQTCIVSYLG